MVRRIDDEKTLEGLRGFWLRLARRANELGAVPLIAALQAAAAGLVLLTPQGADLAYTLVQGDASHFHLQIALLVLACLWLGGESWFWSRRIIDDNCEAYRDKADRSLLLIWSPRLLGGAPFAIAVGAVLRSGEDMGVVAPLVGVVGVSFFLLLVVRTWLVKLGQAKGMLTSRAKTLETISNRIRDAGWLVAFASLAWFSVEPVGVAQAFGAIGVVYLGLGAIVAVMGGVIHWGVRWRAPVVCLSILWAVLMSLLGATLRADNHAVGRRAFGGDIAAAAPAETPGTIAKDPRATFKDAFEAWYAQAPALPDGSKPMVVVAAAGGASRAGFWAAEVLGRLQDESQGRFARSVFAVSSVSGGSVGSAAFVSQLAEKPFPANVSFRETVRGASRGDYLSPALGGLLFPDLAQRFLPTVPRGGGKVAALPDRAEGLERAFERGWTDHCVSADVCQRADLWGRPFLSLWPRLGAWSVPLWFVNGARQEDGRRVLTAPVKIMPAEFPDAVDFHVLTTYRDIPISSAIHNGARFPLVSPGGTLLDGAGKAHGHVLDGGYFENSGVSTAGDIVRAALAYSAAHGGKGVAAIRPILIELNNDADANAFGPEFYRFGAAPDPRKLAGAVTPKPSKAAPSTSYVLADLLGPLSGLTSGRDGRATPAAIAVAQGIMRSVTDGAPPTGSYVVVHLTNPRKDGVVVRRQPMDWVLSKRAQDDMADATAECHARAALDTILAGLPNVTAPSHAPCP